MQRFLLDTNVLGDIINRNPEPTDLLKWLDDKAHLCFVSSISIHELEFGVARLAIKKSVEDRLKATKYAWLNSQLLSMFSDRILPVDKWVLVRSAELRAKAGQCGGDIGLADAIIAATADIRCFYVITRNVGHFRATGATVIDTDNFTESLQATLADPRNKSRFSSIRNEFQKQRHSGQVQHSTATDPAQESIKRLRSS